MNNKVNAGTFVGNVPANKYSSGPFISDVLAIIPVKTAGVQNGQTLIFDGGTLQTQRRQNFGLVGRGFSPADLARKFKRRQVRCLGRF